ncbi:UNVERIFIED_CONTAM: hypothetical protein FKN15_054023 [Acipenser sinensis]
MFKPPVRTSTAGTKIKESWQNAIELQCAKQQPVYGETVHSFLNPPVIIAEERRLCINASIICTAFQLTSCEKPHGGGGLLSCANGSLHMEAALMKLFVRLPGMNYFIRAVTHTPQLTENIIDT